MGHFLVALNHRSDVVQGGFVECLPVLLLSGRATGCGDGFLELLQVSEEIFGVLWLHTIFQSLI